MIGFSSSFNTNYKPTHDSTSADAVPLMFVDLPHFLPALKFQSLTGMVAVKCMIVVLISACVYDDVFWGRGVVREEESRRAFFRNQRSFLSYPGGMLCSSDRVVSRSVCECPFAYTSSPPGGVLGCKVAAV